MIKEKQSLFIAQERRDYIAEIHSTKDLLLGRTNELQNDLIEHKGNFTRHRNTRLSKKLQKVGVNILVAFIPKRELRMEVRKKLLQKICM